MKENELRELTTCSLCGNKIGKAGLVFHKITVESYIVNLGAAQRQTGLAVMLGGNGRLAGIMGPDEDMAEMVSDCVHSVCMVCAASSEDIAALIEEPRGAETSKDGNTGGLR